MDKSLAKTDSSQYVTIKGADGETKEQMCDADFDVFGQDVLCTFQSSANIGTYRCVSLRTGGNNGIELIKVIDKRIYLFMTYFTISLSDITPHYLY